MDTKPESTGAASSGDMQMPTTPEQVQLVHEKVAALSKARELQSQLAIARAELTKIDTRMLKSGFKVPVLACW